MSVEQVVELLMAALKDDIVGMVSKEENTVTISFSDGTIRKIIVV